MYCLRSNDFKTVRKRLSVLLAITMFFSSFLYGCAPADQVNLIYHKVKVGEKTNSVTIEVTVRNDGETLENVNPIDGSFFHVATLTSATGKVYESPEQGPISQVMSSMPSGATARKKYRFSGLEESGNYTLEFCFYKSSFVIENIEIQLPE